jgi:hypothetical protein
VIALAVAIAVTFAPHAADARDFAACGMPADARDAGTKSDGDRSSANLRFRIVTDLADHPPLKVVAGEQLRRVTVVHYDAARLELAAIADYIRCRIDENASTTAFINWAEGLSCPLVDARSKHKNGTARLLLWDARLAYQAPDGTWSFGATIGDGRCATTHPRK